MLDDRARGHVKLYAHFRGENLRERRLAKAWRTAKKHVIQRLSAPACSLHEHAQVVLVLVLADVVFEGLWTKRAVEGTVVGVRFTTDNARRLDVVCFGFAFGHRVRF